MDPAKTAKTGLAPQRNADKTITTGISRKKRNGKLRSASGENPNTPIQKRNRNVKAPGSAFITRPYLRMSPQLPWGASGAVKWCNPSDSQHCPDSSNHKLGEARCFDATKARGRPIMARATIMAMV